MERRRVSRTGLAPGMKRRGADKVRRRRDAEPIVVRPPRRPKPAWLRVRMPSSPQVARIKSILRRHRLASVCEEAQCPNLGECFGRGVATFMILGEICTRRCAFCDVAHGIPLPPDDDEPRHLAAAVAEMNLRYVVVTSVDRDDLADGGAGHFVECVRWLRRLNPGIRVEILVPDFRNRMEPALARLLAAPPDVFNHNLETVPALYKTVRPGADYRHSLHLLAEHRRRAPTIPTKSGLMLGLGETRAQLLDALADLRAHDVQWLTLGQYLQPSAHHLPVARFVPPAEFDELAAVAEDMGFAHVASGPLVRSSFHADRQAEAADLAVG